MRIAGPTILVSFLLLLLCGAAAFYLYSEQAASVSVHRENITSAQVGNELKNTLIDLAGLLRSGKGPPEPLHRRIKVHLEKARELADPGVEKDLEERLEKSLQSYFDVYAARRGPDDRLPPEAVLEALAILE